MIISALIPGKLDINLLQDFDLNEGSCGCKIENVRKGEFQMNFTLDHYYNETEKSNFLSILALTQNIHTNLTILIKYFCLNFLQIIILKILKNFSNTFSNIF